MSQVDSPCSCRAIFESAPVAMLQSPEISEFPSARQLVRQDGGVTTPRAGRGRPGWPMAAHQLASAYKNFPISEKSAL